MTSGKRQLLFLAGGFVALSACCCGIGFPIPGTDILFLLIAGWIPFLHRVLPQARIRWEMVASAVAYIVLLLAVLHYFLRWFHREMTNKPISGTRGVAGAWRWKWTGQICVTFVLMFVVGLAATGAVRQMGWLLGSKKGIYEGYRENRNKRYCEENLKAMWKSLNGYAAEHQGLMPGSLEALRKWNDEDQSRVFQWEINLPTPSGNGTTMERHDSYIYFGMTVRPDAKGDAVLVVDSPENHRHDGIHVLYKDGKVAWLEDSKATEFLRQLPLAAPSTQPAAEVKAKG